MRSVRTRLRWFLATLLVAVAPGASHAQSLLTIRVADTTGAAIPYAVLDANPGGRRVADSLGVVIYSLGANANAVRVQARRIGYAPASVLLQTSERTHEIRLEGVARGLSEIRITDRRNNLLVDRGFYDRVDRVRNGAYTGEFITPEDLERLSPASLSRALSESRYVRITRAGSRSLVVLRGRSDCGYNILIDGMRVRGTLEEDAPGTTSINPQGTRRQGAPTGIEELINGLEIAAIEVYPSAATAPAEIQARAMAGRGTCGIIAIWTGRGA
jgi:hypothetical protein